MDSKKKTCFLIPSVKSGGIETYLLRFLKYLDGDANVTVLVRSNSKGELYEAYKATGAKIVFRPLGYFNLPNMFWYYRFFKKGKFNVICDFNANFAGIPIFLSKLTGIRNRITFYRQSSHHFSKTKFRVAYTNFVNRLVYKHSTAIYANSEAGLKFFFQNEYPQDKRFKVIKNGVDINDFVSSENVDKNGLRKKLGLPSDKFIIGHTGRYAEAKNHHFLLNVAKGIISQDDSVLFVLIGNDTDKLMLLVEQLGIVNNVLILGYKSNIPEYLKAFDMYFFPSVTEGQPNALIEAMISGLPVIASDIPPIRECMPQEVSFSLIDPYDVESTVIKLINAKTELGKYVFQQHAIENFDSVKQFKLFKDLLFKSKEQ
ncbi:glycosyltransferase [Flavobacterium litorale]|uniref:Glycosyltransferase n=1 Tax=Flavobacterium litorale TaxID=2856519 RepID=A0ABX8V3F6_9FLAO|nr:glycosyltransferase [Flavobacterium litorale]QYJ67302.1 glycosyltransferase [Flavobacterium litorale]